MKRARLIAAVGLALAAAIVLAAGAPLAATQVKIFQTQSQSGFLAGTLEGVSVDDLGRMELAPRVERLTALEEPFLLAAAVHPEGWVVGTGNAGRVLRIDRQGKAQELFAAPEPEIFAVWVDADGTVFAGSSPRGKVYRIPATKGAKAKAEVYFDPGETYIWGLARAADGALLVATGTQGKVFRVTAAGRGEVLYDSDDTHARTLQVTAGGDLLVGTAGEGLLLRLAGGKGSAVRTLYDAKQPEVVALAAAPDGTCYAAVIASEASLVDPGKPAGAQGEAKPAPAEGGESQGEVTISVTVEGEGTPSPTAPRKDAGGNRSEILRVSPAGVVEKVWSFAEETVYSLLWRDGALWVGTGLEGKLYRFDGTQMLLEKDVDERQVVALLPPAPGDPGPAFATTNAAALYHVTAGREARGTYTSAALDAGQAARFGSFRWQGEPRGGAVRFSFRSGMSAEPDRTWSAWTEPREGEEIRPEGVPLGRYVQWRAELRAGAGGGGGGTNGTNGSHGANGNGTSPRIYAVELAYRQENLRPRIDSFTALEPGRVLVPTTFNPSNQVYEPAHPNRDGIFTSLEPSLAGEEGRLKPLWKKGYRSLSWSAADPNEDRLRYDLTFQPAAGEGADRGDHGWMKMAEDLKETSYSFDATVLPDGVYRFRLQASDREGNEPADALVAEQVSDPVVIDHTPPVLAGVEAAGGTLRVQVRDAANPLREAMMSTDAGEWKPVRAADGLLDGRTETLLVEPPAGGADSGLLLLRVTDAAYNVVTFDLTRRR